MALPIVFDVVLANGSCTGHNSGCGSIALNCFGSTTVSTEDVNIIAQNSCGHKMDLQCHHVREAFAYMWRANAFSPGRWFSSSLIMRTLIITSTLVVIACTHYYYEPVRQSVLHYIWIIVALAFMHEDLKMATTQEGLARWRFVDIFHISLMAGASQIAISSILAIWSWRSARRDTSTLGITKACAAKLILCGRLNAASSVYLTKQTMNLHRWYNCIRTSEHLAPSCMLLTLALSKFATKKHGPILHWV